MTAGSDVLLEAIDAMVRYIIDVDLPDLDDDVRERLVGHLTGALFVTVTKVFEATRDRE